MERASLYPNPEVPLDEINCGNYEILGFEPLHDISHHIENVLTELPSHLPKKEASELNALTEFCIGGKETKRAFDYRCALILISNQIRGKINTQAQLFLDTPWWKFRKLHMLQKLNEHKDQSFDSTILHGIMECCAAW